MPSLPIQALSEFKDPRAVQGLSNAFFAVTVDTGHRDLLSTESFATNNAFPPETANIIQCEALAALGKTKNAAAVELLVRRVARPGPNTVVEASEQEKQQNRDLRLAAIRGLGNFSHYQATEALVAVIAQGPRRRPAPAGFGVAASEHRQEEPGGRSEGVGRAVNRAAGNAERGQAGGEGIEDQPGQLELVVEELNRRDTEKTKAEKRARIAEAFSLISVLVFSVSLRLCGSISSRLSWRPFASA